MRRPSLPAGAQLFKSAYLQTLPHYMPQVCWYAVQMLWQRYSMVVDYWDCPQREAVQGVHVCCKLQNLLPALMTPVLNQHWFHRGFPVKLLRVMPHVAASL
jgi:hypothetical protein